MITKLLLVEDDPTTCAFLVAAAQSLPADVDAADCVATAIALASAHDYDLWLIDANLPDGDGAGLLATLRAQRLQTPALAHTASNDGDTRSALLGAGFLDVLVKPLPAADLHAAIRTVLGARRLRLAQSAQSAHAAHSHANATPAVWDDATAFAALNGQRAHVDALRELFVDQLPAARDAVQAAAASGNVIAMQAALHKLRASCGFVGASQLSAAVVTLQSAPGCPTALAEFLDAAQLALSSP